MQGEQCSGRASTEQHHRHESDEQSPPPRPALRLRHQRVYRERQPRQVRCHSTTIASAIISVNSWLGHHSRALGRSAPYHLRCRSMEDIVAVEVRLAGGQRRYFLTWGRIQDAVDPRPLAEIVLRNASAFSLDGDPVSARVLWDVSPAMTAPYFGEAFFAMCQRPIPFGQDTSDGGRASRRSISCLSA